MNDVDNEGQFEWVDGSDYDKLECWASDEPTSTKLNGTRFASQEDCVHIAPDKGYYWNDLNCSGINDKSNIQVKGYLCNNPYYVEEVDCGCNSDRCYIWGDPHFLTFDSLTHHYQGACGYNYVTSCELYLNETQGHLAVPFEISGAHTSCYHLPDRTCLEALYVRLFNDMDGSLITEMRLEQGPSGLCACLSFVCVRVCVCFLLIFAVLTYEYN